MQAANPEACYRWISTISKHPELFSALPARQSLLDNPGVTGQGADVVAFYKAFKSVIQDPTALIFSKQHTSIESYMIEIWLNRAFENYVLQNSDLDTELKQAEEFSKGFQGCTANISPSTAATQQDQTAYFKQFTDCTIKIDSTLKSYFGPS